MNPIGQSRVRWFRSQTSIEGVNRLMSALLQEEDHDPRAVGAPRIPGYVFDELLGRGAGGSVYLAFWGENEDPVAVKVLAKPVGSSKSDQRAWRELDILSQLNLPGVPRVLDYGIAEGRLYITTRLVHGRTLLKHCQQAGLSVADRVRLLITIAELVQRVHEHGVIHRDLKPTNIMIQPDGSPVLLDFGIAHLTDDTGAEPLTAAGDPIGTVGYMAPEQARGEPAVTSRCDIYALGAIACQMLTGQTPHDVNVAAHEAIRRVAQEPARDPMQLDPRLPKSLALIVAKALESKPEDRFASAAEMADDLKRWLRNEPIPWQATHWLSGQLLAIKRNPAAFMAKAAIWVLLVAALFAGTLAYAGFQTAAGERKNAQEATRLRQLAEDVAADQAALLKRQAELAAHWEAEAREREEWRKEVEEENLKRAALRERQIARVKKAIESGQLFDASIVLLNFAEEIKEIRPNDKAMLDAFVEHLNMLIETAAAGGAPPNPNQ